MKTATQKAMATAAAQIKKVRALLDAANKADGVSAKDKAAVQRTLDLLVRAESVAASGANASSY